MTTKEVIQQFINYIGDKQMTEDEVKRYFMNLGIGPNEIFGWLFSTPGIRNINDIIWYDNGVAKLPPNQPH